MAITNKLLTLILDHMEESGHTESRAVADCIRDASSAEDIEGDTDVSMARAVAKDLIDVCQTFLTEMKYAERNG